MPYSGIIFSSKSKEDKPDIVPYDMIIDGMRSMHMSALVACALLAFFSFWDSNTAIWVILFLFSCIIFYFRTRFIHGALKISGDNLALERYFYKWRLFWIVNAMQWGLWPLAFYGNLAPEVEAICWMLLAGVTGTSIIYMSIYPAANKKFIWTIIFCEFLSVVCKMVCVENASDTYKYIYWYPVLLVFYIILLFRVSNKLYAMHVERFDLGVKNSSLIEELKKQVKAAEELSYFKSRFLAGAAHDLRQPVNALGIYSEWLSNEPELAHELGPKILQSVKAINRLFDSLFDWVKLESGQLQLNIKEFDLKDILQDLRYQYKAVAFQKGLKLRLRIRGNLILQSDVIMMERIISNLISNSIKYTNKGGVLISAKGYEDKIRIRIFDTGIGLAESDIQMVFNDFYKVPQNGTEDGFGLGLPIVKRLGDCLSCSIFIKSKFNFGSIFTIEVPRKFSNNNCNWKAFSDF